MTERSLTSGLVESALFALAANRSVKASEPKAKLPTCRKERRECF